MFSKSMDTVSLMLTMMKVGLTVKWPNMHIEPVPVDGSGGGGSLFNRSSTTVSLILTLIKVGLTVNWPAMHIKPMPVDGGGGGGKLVHQVHHHCVPYTHTDEGWTHR